MKKLSKEQIQEVLHKNIMNCTENELRFVFHVLSFDLKEMKQECGRTRFEVHFKCNYVMRIEIAGNHLSFSNEWIRFNEEYAHRLLTSTPDCLGKLVVIFINMFMPNVLQKINYGIVYNEDWSVFDSYEEAHSYFITMQTEIEKILESTKEKE